MNLKDLSQYFSDAARRVGFSVGGYRSGHIYMQRYALGGSQSPSFLEQSTNDVEKLFYSSTGAVVHKWLHYFDIYERHFSKYCHTDFRMLEIGVDRGGSLNLWRRYFGDKATIFGIDINPKCADFVTAPNQVRIGSQADPVFLESVVNEMGAPDIILDDGSHKASHQLESFRVLFPLLKHGGLYVIEDIHTSYWGAEFQGGHNRSGTAVDLIKRIVDDMHAWYHEKKTTTPGKLEIIGVHVYDSIVVLEKGQKKQPAHIQIGGNV